LRSRFVSLGHLEAHWCVLLPGVIRCSSPILETHGGASQGDCGAIRPEPGLDRDRSRTGIESRAIVQRSMISGHADERQRVTKPGRVTMQQPYVSYLRVSRDKMALYGHGLDAQRKAVSDLARGNEPLKEVVEVETGKRNNRPKLKEALAVCKKHKATLVIAKLDRLSRNVHFISGLMESKVPFVCCDMPDAKKLTIHILAAIAEHEREMIAKRTKEGLAAAKAKGIVLGNREQAKANRDSARERAKLLAPALLQFGGMSATQTALALNAQSVPTPTGRQWSAKTVIRVRQRLTINQ
jgi:DNA invertase Pin-like site-specific DNA recombinase